MARSRSSADLAAVAGPPASPKGSLRRAATAGAGLRRAATKAVDKLDDRMRGVRLVLRRPR